MEALQRVNPTVTMVDIVIVTDKNTAMPVLETVGEGDDMVKATVTAVVFDKDSSVVDQTDTANAVTFAQSTDRASTGMRKQITMRVPFHVKR